MANKKCHLLVKIGDVFKRCYLRYNNTNKVLIYKKYYYSDVSDYEYTNIDYNLKLNKYIGNQTDVTLPNIKEE